MPGLMGRGSEGLGERELSEGLGLHTAPREVSYLAVVVGVLVVGALATFVISTVAALPRRSGLTEESAISAVDLSAASELYRRGQFADARTAFASLARAHPDNVRVQDYLVRLDRVDVDAASIARARARLALGDPDSALGITRDIAGNSPLFPDAWAIAQKAHEELTRRARAQEESEREARALEEARLASESERHESEARAHRRRVPRTAAAKRAARHAHD